MPSGRMLQGSSVPYRARLPLGSSAAPSTKLGAPSSPYVVSGYVVSSFKIFNCLTAYDPMT